MSELRERYVPHSWPVRDVYEPGLRTLQYWVGPDGGSMRTGGYWEREDGELVYKQAWRDAAVGAPMPILWAAGFYVAVTDNPTVGVALFLMGSVWGLVTSL